MVLLLLLPHPSSSSSIASWRAPPAVALLLQRPVVTEQQTDRPSLAVAAVAQALASCGVVVAFARSAVYGS
jgi:hypothetical protein